MHLCRSGSLWEAYVGNHAIGTVPDYGDLMRIPNQAKSGFLFFRSGPEFAVFHFGARIPGGNGFRSKNRRETPETAVETIVTADTIPKTLTKVDTVMSLKGTPVRRK